MLGREGQLVWASPDFGLHAEATTVRESTTLKLGEALGHKALCLDSALLKLLRKCIYLGFFWLFSSQRLNPLDYFVPAIFFFGFFWLLIFAILRRLF